ncbi:hypothetical protein [Acidicapsa acidisoli]|uniref:hypothetical protein n=1 Tax=Acidicapsa acidisoli TaxID=1615681 RepID=UPI0021E07161|nr:hypothetical protein [Acidicapsa acidisoli]
MTPALARLLTRLYPRNWRARYGAEFEAFLQDTEGGISTAINIVCSALGERIFPTQGGNMNPDPNSFGAITKQPSAFLPLTMSLTALTMLASVLICELIQNGQIVREADEGTVAHLWQILMAGQLPIIAFFAIKWLPRAPKPTLGILALQAGAALASMAPVYFLNL